MSDKDVKEGSAVLQAPLLQEEDIFGGIGRLKGTSLFLGKYSLTEVSAVLGKKNFFREARKRHLWPLEFSMDSSEFPMQRFQVFYKERKPENVVVDLKVKESTFQVKNPLLLGFSTSTYKLLAFEWLTLQNPLLRFTAQRTPLPGQAYPGLGLSKKVIDLFLYLAKLLKNDGLLAFPAYFHNALLFSRYFYFANPEKWGEVQAIHKTFRRLPLKQLAWIVHWNCLRDRNNNVYEWRAEEQVCPLNRSLRSYFTSRLYKMRAQYSMKRHKFTIDWECYNRKAAEFAGQIS